MFDVRDRVVVVTGAAGGIGRGLAEAAAARGARVALADIDEVRARAAAAEIGGAARGFQVDITSRPSLQALAEAVEAAFGGVNVLFNNAGVFTGGRLERTTPEDFDWVFDVNVRGLYNAVTLFLPLLKAAAARGELAHIVNTGSENSIGLPSVGAFSAYTATKHAVLGLSESLRRDLAPDRVGVSIICPGMVQTELWNAKRSRHDRYGGPKQARPEAGQGMEAGRTPAETAETTFQGLDAGEFLIVTDSRIRGDHAQARLDEIARALDVCDQRVGPL